MQFDVTTIEKLEKEYGLPLYVFDEKAFFENYNRFEKCFCSSYKNYRVSYSYKTNYTPYVCKLVKQLGGYAEVVSGMEYHIAKKIGYDDSRIIFNGPDKGQDGIDAFLNGCIVNADNIEELRRICDAGKRHPDKKLKCGLRVNLDIGQSFVSRFGMDSSDMDKAFEMVSQIPNLTISGLHCHISRCRGIEAWRKRTEIMLSLTDRYFAEPPEYIDLGSGMFGAMAPSFAAQFTDVPSYEDYASVTARLVAEHYKGTETKPILFTEPGTTLINKYFDVIAKVDAIKTVNGKTFAVLNCSEHNLGETCTLKQLPMEVLHMTDDSSEYADVDFTGYTCLEQDVMYTGYNGRLAVDDYVVFGNTGGYSNVLKPPFIKPNCAMIACASSTDYALIKRAENYGDILHTYIF